MVSASVQHLVVDTLMDKALTMQRGDYERLKRAQKKLERRAKGKKL
jgi:hypothetical protein